MSKQLSIPKARLISSVRRAKKLVASLEEQIDEHLVRYDILVQKGEKGLGELEKEIDDLIVEHATAWTAGERIIAALREMSKC